MSEGLATEWRNGAGKSRWQPSMPDGLRKWKRFDGYTEEVRICWSPHRPLSFEPVTYRSRRRAERVASRAMREVERARLGEWEEVSHE
jgi:hypothetical protein